MPPRSKRPPARRPSAAEAAQATELFNRLHPAGSRVWYWRTLPFGPVVETVVASTGAFVSDSGDVVCFLRGVSGYVSCWHIKPVDESRRKDLQIEVLS